MSHSSLATNWTHPEVRSGEVFFRNCCTAQFHTLELSSKRQGTRAYDGGGQPLHFQDWRPVFVNEKELTKRHLELLALRRLLLRQEVTGCCNANPKAKGLA